MAPPPIPVTSRPVVLFSSIPSEELDDFQQRFYWLAVNFFGCTMDDLALAALQASEGRPDAGPS